MHEDRHLLLRQRRAEDDHRHQGRALPALIAEQRKAGKAVGYLSVPLSSGRRRQLQRQQGSRRERQGGRREALRRRLHLRAESRHARGRPAEGRRCRLHADVDELLEGPDGLGDFDFVYFAGPQDFARYFGFDGNADMAKLDAYFDKRVKSDPGLRRRRCRAGSPSRRSAATTRCAHRRS